MNGAAGWGAPASLLLYAHALMESYFSPLNLCGNSHIGKKVDFFLERICEPDDSKAREMF